MKKGLICLVLASLLLLPAFGLGEELRVPSSSRSIHTEWVIWNDGVPVTIRDGGPYKLGKGKTGGSVIISGLLSVGGKCKGEVYLYEPKTRQFKKRGGKAEPDKDSIRLVYEDLTNEDPMMFSLPRSRKDVLFPTVWVCVDSFIKGNPVNRVYLNVVISETESIRIWSDHYETVSTAGGNAELLARYTPEGKLMDAKYTLQAGSDWYHYYYRRKAVGYGRYEIEMDEIETSGGDKQSLRWKDGVWKLRWGSGEPEESSIPKGIDYDPCKIVGDPVTLEFSSDTEDSSWMAPVDFSKGIPACIPDIVNTPLLPYVHYENKEDGSSRMMMEGLNYWGVQEDELCEWTLFGTFDPENLSDEELEFMLEESGNKAWEWRITGESSAEHLLTAVIPAAKLNPDWFGLTLHRKNGTVLDVYYEPEYRLDLSTAVGNVEYSWFSSDEGESELKYITEDRRCVNADYDQTDGRLIRYEVSVDLPDGGSVLYTHERNDDVSELEYRLEKVSHWKDGQCTHYIYRGENEWYFYSDSGDKGETESLPEELAEACTPITVILPEAE